MKCLGTQGPLCSSHLLICTGANEIKMGIYNGELRNDEIGDQHGAEMKTINQTDITIRPSETRQNLVR